MSNSESKYLKLLLTLMELQKEINLIHFFREGCIMNGLKIKNPTKNCLPHLLVILADERTKKWDPQYGRYMRTRPKPNYYKLLEEGERDFISGASCTKCPGEFRFCFNILLLDRQSLMEINSAGEIRMKKRKFNKRNNDYCDITCMMKNKDVCRLFLNKDSRPTKLKRSKAPGHSTVFYRCEECLERL